MAWSKSFVLVPFLFHLTILCFQEDEITADETEEKAQNPALTDDVTQPEDNTHLMKDDMLPDIQPEDGIHTEDDIQEEPPFEMAECFEHRAMPVPPCTSSTVDLVDHKRHRTDLTPSRKVRREEGEVRRGEKNEKSVQFVEGSVKEKKQSSESGCSHKSGQELCYLCHQRQKRNIPISFAEEKVRSYIRFNKTSRNPILRTKIIHILYPVDEIWYAWFML